MDWQLLFLSCRRGVKAGEDRGGDAVGGGDCHPIKQNMHVG